LSQSTERERAAIYRDTHAHKRLISHIDANVFFASRENGTTDEFPSIPCPSMFAVPLGFHSYIACSLWNYRILNKKQTNHKHMLQEVTFGNNFSP
jgi:hypothetical protein